MSCTNDYKKKREIVKYFFTFIVICILGTSCNRIKIERDIANMMGTRVVVPYDSLYALHEIDKVQIDAADYVYVVYYDSTVCSVCTLKNGYYWETLRDSLRQVEKNVEFVFVYAPPKEEIPKFINELKYVKNTFVTLVDTIGVFGRNNKHISSNSNLHAFLLDKERKVVMVGNVQSTPAVEKLFWKSLSGDNEK